MYLFAKISNIFDFSKLIMHKMCKARICSGRSAFTNDIF